MGIYQGCQCAKGFFEEDYIEAQESVRNQSQHLSQHQSQHQSNQLIKIDFFSNDEELEQETKEATFKIKGGNSKWNEIRDKIQSNITNIGRFSTSEEFIRIVPDKYIQYSKENPIEEYIGDTDSLIPLEPIRFQNGNYYWGNWNEDIEMSGSGKMYLVNEIVYVEGIWKNGSIYKGRILMPDDSIYEGELDDCQLNGKGKLLYSDEKRYEGTFANGNRDGKGVLLYPDGSRYEGDFLNDMFDGEGTFKWSDKHEYQGQFKANTLNGKGVLRNRKGSSYIGEFKNNVFHGKGVFKWSTGDKYDGNYSYGLKEGKGEYSSNDNTHYTGGWLDGLPHGQLTIEKQNEEYVSFWRNGHCVEISNLNQNKEYNSNDLDLWPLKEDIDPNRLQYLKGNNNQIIHTGRSFEPNEIVIVDGIL